MQLHKGGFSFQLCSSHLPFPLIQQTFSQGLLNETRDARNSKCCKLQTKIKTWKNYWDCQLWLRQEEDEGFIINCKSSTLFHLSRHVLNGASAFEFRQQTLHITFMLIWRSKQQVICECPCTNILYLWTLTRQSPNPNNWSTIFSGYKATPVIQ